MWRLPVYLRSPSNHTEMGAPCAWSAALLPETPIHWPWTGAAVPRQHSTLPLLHSPGVEKKVRSTCITRPVHGNHNHKHRAKGARTGLTVWKCAGEFPDCCLSQGHMTASNRLSGLVDQKGSIRWKAEESGFRKTEGSSWELLLWESSNHFPSMWYFTKIGILWEAHRLG